MRSSQAVTTPGFMMVLERATDNSLERDMFALLRARAAEQLGHPPSRYRPQVFAGKKGKRGLCTHKREVWGQQAGLGCRAFVGATRGGGGR